MRWRARHVSRAFTLVELLVAIAAGAMVAMAALTLSKNATNLFQNEARIASAQLAVTMGLNRLAADVQRAAFLSSPNIHKDPWRCDGGGLASWPVGLQRLAGVTIINGGSVTAHPTDLTQSTHPNNGFNPDALILGGSFDTTEQFPVAAIAGGVVYLQQNSAAMWRAQQSAASGGPALATVFAPGRFLRIVNEQGYHEWAVISAPGYSQPSGQLPQVTISGSPSLPTSLTASCGYAGPCVGCLANPVSRVRYELRSVANVPRYKKLVTAVSNAATGDDRRTELVRFELNEIDLEKIDTLEVVAEYAVDLKFGITTVNGNSTNPTLTRFAIANPQPTTIYDRTNIPTSCAGVCTPCPEGVRSLQVRLSTRSRAPDRRVTVTSGLAPDGSRHRFFIPLPSSTTSPAWARLRTHYADIALPNQANLPWGGCP